jgi:hypothetical protein
MRRGRTAQRRQRSRFAALRTSATRTGVGGRRARVPSHPQDHPRHRVTRPRLHAALAVTTCIMTEIFEVSAAADRADELIKWLGTKGLSDTTATALLGSSGRGDFAGVVSGVLDQGRAIILAATDDGSSHLLLRLDARGRRSRASGAQNLMAQMVSFPHSSRAPFPPLPFPHDFLQRPRAPSRSSSPFSPASPWSSVLRSCGRLWIRPARLQRARTPSCAFGCEFTSESSTAPLGVGRPQARLSAPRNPR